MEQNLGPHMLQKCATLAASFGQCFVVVFLRGFGVQAQVELVLPAEVEARLAKRIVARAPPGGPLATSAACAAIL